MTEAAELFWHIADQLPAYNEARLEFIASVLLNHNANIVNSFTSHHYCMPTYNSVTMGGHVTKKDMEFPLLTLPGKNIFLIKYFAAKEKDLLLPNKGEFLTPHGLGKQDVLQPTISIDTKLNTCILDGYLYSIKWGESLRAHPTLKLRAFDREKVFSYMSLLYDFEITDEFVQLASINNMGPKIWDTGSL